MKKIILFLILAVGLFAQTIDLSSVRVGNRSRPLTNAKIKSVTDGGITFICDQGLLQIPFEHLPAEFQVYKSKVNKSSNLAQDKAAAQTVTKNNKPATNTKAAPKVETEAERAKKALAKSILRDKLLSQIPHYEGLISRYDKQSSFSGETLISSAENDNNKAQLEEAKRKLAELGN